MKQLYEKIVSYDYKKGIKLGTKIALTGGATIFVLSQIPADLEESSKMLQYIQEGGTKIGYILLGLGIGTGAFYASRGMHKYVEST